MIRLLAVLTTFGLLQSCATTPQPTLELSEVPVLYEAPYEAPAVNKQIVPPVEDKDKDELITEISDVSPEVSENNETRLEIDSCETIAEEIKKIDTGLGSVAVEEPPNMAWPSAAKRTGGFLYNLTTQTVLGVLQPVIQTKRAIFNNDEKDRRLAESVERGKTRRAYLIGYAHASGCNQKVDGPLEITADVETNNDSINESMDDSIDETEN